MFVSFTAEHSKNVAIWLGKVFGGPARYTQEHGGHRTVLERHRNLGLSPNQKERWVHLMLETAQEMLPKDTELQARFADYIRGAPKLRWRLRSPALRFSMSDQFQNGDGLPTKERSSQAHRVNSKYARQLRPPRGGIQWSAGRWLNP